MSLPTPFRFALEAVLLVALGAALAAADLALLPFVLLMGAAWILLATSERMLSRPDDEAMPAVWRTAPERTDEPAARREVPKPVSEPPRRRLPESKPAEPEVSQEAEPESQPERALGVVTEPEPEEREPEPDEPVVELPQTANRRPDGWNLWDLERRAHQLAGHDPIRDEEWSALFVSLRGFAEPDGTLPHEFDTLVEESFAELTSRPA